MFEGKYYKKVNPGGEYYIHVKGCSQGIYFGDMLIFEDGFSEFAEDAMTNGIGYQEIESWEYQEKLREV